MKDKDWNYFKKAEAHRTYLYAMSMYKHLRYVKKNVKVDPGLKTQILKQSDPVLSAQEALRKTNFNKEFTWLDVDQQFISAIEKYNQKELRVDGSLNRFEMMQSIDDFE